MFSVRKAVLLAALAGALAGSACSGNPEVEKREALARGEAYFKEGRNREAIIEYRRAIQLDPGFVEPRLRLLEVYRQNGNVARAYAEITRAADLLPENIDLQIEAGRWQLAAGRYEAARDRADRVLKQTPDHPRALILRGNALARLKDLYGALEDMEKAVSAAPDEGLPYASLAVVQLARGELDAADLAFRKALELDPHDALARLAYTNYLLSSQRPAEAEKQLQEALRMDPDNVVVARALAGFYVITRQAAKAEPHLKRLAETSNDPAASFALARLYMGLGRHEDAVRVLTALAAQTASAADAKLQLAAISYAQGQKANAHGLVNEVLSGDAEHARALLLRSGFLLQEDKPVEAIAPAQSTIKIDPQLAQGYFVLGLAYTALGRFEEARKAFDEQLSIEPGDVRAFIGLSRLELAAGNTDRASELADKAAGIAPTAPAVRAAVLRVALEQGRLDRAESEMKGIRAAKFDTADSYLLEGQLRLAQRNRPAARRAFARAAELAPQSLAAATELIQLDLAEGRIRVARERADQLAAQAKESPPALLLAGRTYATSNDFGTAERFFKEAITADPSAMAAYAALGGLYLRQGRGSDALAEFQALAASLPKSVTAHTMVAALLEAQGQKAEAKQAYRKVLDIDASAVVASNNLAWMMVQDNENLDQALQLAQTARGRLPGSPDIADTVGWIYYKKGMYAQAVSDLRLAVRGQPTNAEFLYHYGLASARNGDDQVARQHLEQALKISPRSPYAIEARNALPRLRTRGDGSSGR